MSFCGYFFCFVSVFFSLFYADLKGDGADLKKPETLKVRLLCLGVCLMVFCRFDLALLPGWLLVIVCHAHVPCLC